MPDQDEAPETNDDDPEPEPPKTKKAAPAKKGGSAKAAPAKKSAPLPDDSGDNDLDSNVQSTEPAQPPRPKKTVPRVRKPRTGANCEQISPCTPAAKLRRQASESAGNVISRNRIICKENSRG